MGIPEPGSEVPVAIPFAAGFKIIAGLTIVPVDNALWMSELNNLVRIPLDAPLHGPGGLLDISYEPVRIEAYDPTLMSDNLDLIHEDVVAFPYYRVHTDSEGAMMMSAWRAGW